MGKPARKTNRTGLKQWMQRVLDQWVKAKKNPTPARIHQLRVALRRCRSMCTALKKIPGAQAPFLEINHTSKSLFKMLGPLRDTHVMARWVRQLGKPDDPVRKILLKELKKKEKENTRAAEKAIGQFHVKKWKKWIADADKKKSRLQFPEPAFIPLAKQRLNKAKEFHRFAEKIKTEKSYHQIRIGLKKFRYVIENFMPKRHAKWGKNLKQMQDFLGEMHDLHVLDELIQSHKKEFSKKESEYWRQIIKKEYRKRLTSYRRMARGKNSRWNVWTRGLKT